MRHKDFQTCLGMVGLDPKNSIGTYSLFLIVERFKNNIDYVNSIIDKTNIGNAEEIAGL